LFSFSILLELKKEEGGYAVANYTSPDDDGKAQEAVQRAPTQSLLEPDPTELYVHNIVQNV
jgi:hypothetical protein